MESIKKLFTDLDLTMKEMVIESHMLTEGKDLTDNEITAKSILYAVFTEQNPEIIIEFNDDRLSCRVETKVNEIKEYLQELRNEMMD